MRNKCKPKLVVSFKQGTLLGFLATSFHPRIFCNSKHNLFSRTMYKQTTTRLIREQASKKDTCRL